MLALRFSCYKVQNVRLRNVWHEVIGNKIIGLSLLALHPHPQPLALKPRPPHLCHPI